MRVSARNLGGGVMTSSFDPQALKSASKQFEEQQAIANCRWNQEYRRRQERENAAWSLAEAILRMDHDAHEIQFGGKFVPKRHSRPVLSAFWDVCKIMQEQEFEVPNFDEEKMLEVYGADRDHHLATLGYRQAVVLLQKCSSAQFKKTKMIESELRATFHHIAGRHVWYMISPMVKGLFTEQGRVFPKSAGIPQHLAHVTQFKGRNATRNMQWWTWHQAGMKPAAIRDCWNSAHPEEEIGTKEVGRDTVRKTLKAIAGQISMIH
jgi:hypothetical protein